MFDSRRWQVMRHKALKQGCWFRLRHGDTKQDMWFGSIYVPPSASVGELQEQIADFLNMLPPTTLPCMISGDTNAGLAWHAEDRSVQALGSDGKGRVLLDVLQQTGFQVLPPCDDQLKQPTSRPRQTDSQGRCIDRLACKHATCSRAVVCTDSCHQLGTDHDALIFYLRLKEVTVSKRVRLGARVVTSLPELQGPLNQKELQRLALVHTKTPPKQSYQDDGVAKELFRIAKTSRSSYAWKRALRYRRQEHQKWRENRVLQATSGNWQALRECKPGLHVGWESHFAEAVSPEDPHSTLHKHYETIFSTDTGGFVCPPITCRSPDFTAEELNWALSKGKPRKSVGEDGVSL